MASFSLFLTALLFSQCISVTVVYKTVYTNPGKGSAEVPAYIYLADPPPEQPVPLVVFSHCYLGAGNWYQYLADALIPQGYVMASADTWSYEVDATSEAEALDQQFLVGAVQNEAATNKSSPIYGMLNNKVVAMGHSLGGGATLISAVAQPSLWNSIMTLSAEYEPESSKITQPALIMTASDDCICPPATNAVPIYNNITLSPCKYYVEITNGTHCHFDEVNPIIIDDACELVEHDCGPKDNWIPRETQWSIVGNYTIQWLDYTLKGSSAALTNLNNMLQTDQKNQVLTFKSAC